MTAAVVEQTGRRSRQQLVEALLYELAERRRELYRLKAAGVQPMGAREQKRALREARRQLSEAVAAP